MKIFKPNNMKTAKNLVLLGIVMSAFLSSCTMQKCVYSKGYYVDWFGNKHNNSIQKKSTDLMNINETSDGYVNLAESEVSKVNAVYSEQEANPITASASSEDLIIVKENRSAAPERKMSIAERALNKSQQGSHEVTELKAKSAAVATPSGEKSQLTALLICFFVGVLGIHRFYLGYTTIGIIQLLTLGGCGIWALIDLIMIITGDLKPNGGDYDKKL